MEYLIRFAQKHESFRKPEIEALAQIAKVNIEFLTYFLDSPFSIVRLDSEAAARSLVSRSILTDAVYELWGTGTTYDELHADVKRRTQHLWPLYEQDSFKFRVHCFQSKRSAAEQRDIIDGFAYLAFKGPIRMKDAQHEFCVFEEYSINPQDPNAYAKQPTRLFLTRLLAMSGRSAINVFDLKKRRYINTTSMDSELALITANLALAAPGKFFYDPFVGTASFPIACAYFGAVSMGSDIDGRVVRGKASNNITTSHRQYDLGARWLDGFASDLTNSPIRLARYLDGIVCDPPYGIREGIKVLGMKDGARLQRAKAGVAINSVPAYEREGYVPPRKAYSFDAMIEDLFDFAAMTLVDGGRLSIWIPTANEEDVEIEIPQHHCLALVSACVQHFNKWSRRLLTYSRVPDADVGVPVARSKREANGTNADDLNNFRKRYFEGFRTVREG